MSNQTRPYRTGSREVIDARGSIDSRTFNETQEISSIARDARDRHNPSLDTIEHKTWYSRAGQGFDNVPDAGHSNPLANVRPMRSRRVGLNGGVMSGRNDFQGTRPGIPGLFKVGLAIIAILVVILIILLVF